MGTPGGWQDLDEAESPETLLAFLDAFAKLPAVVAAKRRSFDLLEAQPGCRVLDAGCGTGVDVFALADRVRPGGEVVGVDASAGALAIAAGRLDSRTGIRFERADLADLPFPSAHFDRARADRTVQHMPEPEVAVCELVRVTRPGGRLVVSEASFTEPGASPRQGDDLILFLPFLLHRAGVTDIVLEHSESTVEPSPEVLAVLGAGSAMIRIQFVHVAGNVAPQ